MVFRHGKPGFTRRRVILLSFVVASFTASGATQFESLPFPEILSAQSSHYGWLLIAGGFALILLNVIGILVWNRSLRRELARQTDELKSELAERQKVEIALKTMRDELEERVRQRTSDLEMRNRQLDEARIALETANDQLQSLVSVDGLTGIANRRHFDDRLEREIRRAVRSNQPLTLILSDIDFFKAYNDFYGHVRGDEALRRIAALLKRTFRRADDLTARYGGEEFATILYGIGEEDAARIAEKLHRDVRDLQISHEASPSADHLTMSSGVASICSAQVYAPEAIIAAADSALYAAKANGKDRVEATHALPRQPALTLAS